MFVDPIVNDVAREIGVGSSRYAFKKDVFGDSAAVAQSDGFEVVLRSSGDMAQVEQDPLHMGITRGHG